MTVQEFSDQFDVLYNNITSNQAPGLNEYEKSVFLTKAQEEIVKNYFSPKGNPKQDGFDDSPKRQADFSTLVNTVVPEYLSGASKFDARSFAFAYPENVFLTLNEQLMDGSIPIVIVPISFDEYDRLMTKPYKFPPKYQAWRLLTKTSTNISYQTTKTYTTTGNQSVVIVSSYGKPINFIIKTLATVSEPPTVTETDSLVTITLKVGNDVNSAGYITKYSLDEIGNILYEYVGRILSSGSGYTVLPTFSGGSAATILDALHPGGQQNSGTSSIMAEIIGRFVNDPIYKIRYVKRPEPIRLADFSTTGVSLGNGTSAQTCLLPEHLHEEILQRAVELAKVAWTANGQDNAQMVIQAGQRSE